MGTAAELLGKLQGTTSRGFGRIRTRYRNVHRLLADATVIFETQYKIR